MMPPRWNRFVLLLHILSSISWIGAAVVYVVLALLVLDTTDADTIRGILPAMQTITWYVILPLGIAALATGVVQSLGTRWGLLVHYWVAFKLVLTLISIVVLLSYTRSIDQAAELAAQGDDLAALTELQSPAHLIHSAGGVVVLLVASILSVYKPKGLTGLGRDPRGRRPTTTDSRLPKELTQHGNRDRGL